MPTSSHQKSLRLEPLEPRHLMASDWQNAVLHCDVDASAFVEPLDALIVINALNEGGERTLPARPSGSSAPQVDVNGNSRLEVTDVQLILGALNKYNQPLTVAASISVNSDPNQNGVILQELVQLTGSTLADTSIEATLLGQNSSTPIMAAANAAGEYNLSIQVPVGLHTVRVTSRDERGRSESFDLLVRRGDLVHDWNTVALNVIRAWTTTSDDPVAGRVVTAPPPRVSRELAMIHTAMFDAANAVEQKYQSYLVNLSPQTGVSEQAAAASAAYTVAKAIYSRAAELAIWEATLTESLRNIPDSTAKSQGVALGQQVGNSILAARANDGSTAISNYQPVEQPGRWNRTEPDKIPPLLPQWANLTPFSLPSSSHFRPEAPPSLTSAEYASAVDEVMRLGRDDSTERTEEQKRIALFWADGGGTFTPPGHWNAITTDLTLTRTQSLVDRTRTFALVNIALADAAITSWNAKYVYDLWRPIDAIREADTDGNAATIKDASWTPLIKTPPFPAYTSGHSTFSGAAASVLTGIFGTNTSFTVFKDIQSGASQKAIVNNSGLVRQFSSFQQAADEAGMSRIYGGIHFIFDNTAGLRSGDQVGDYVLANELLPKTV